MTSLGSHCNPREAKGLGMSFQVIPPKCYIRGYSLSLATRVGDGFFAEEDLGVLDDVLKCP